MVSKTKILAGVVVLIAIGAVLWASGVIPIGGTNIQIEFYGYDKDGNRVDFPQPWFAYTIGGVEVVDLAFSVTWASTGENVDWTTFEIAGALKIYHLDYYGEIKEDLTSVLGNSPGFGYTGESNKDNSIEYRIPIDTLVDGLSKSGPDYWTIRVDVDVGAEVTDNYDKVLTAGDSATRNFKITEVEESTSFDVSVSV